MFYFVRKQRKRRPTTKLDVWNLLIYLYYNLIYLRLWSVASQLADWSNWTRTVTEFQYYSETQYDDLVVS